MTTSRFDPIEGKPYGTCQTCKIELVTEGEAETHMAETLAAAQAENRSGSHSILITNASRSARIERAIQSLVEDAISDVTGELNDMVGSDAVTEDEVTQALSRWSDFADGWREEVLG